MYTFELDQTALVDGHRKGFLPGALPSLCQGRHGQTRRERTVGGLHRPLLGSLDGGGVIHSPHTRDCLIIECTRYTQLTSSIHPSPPPSTPGGMSAYPHNNKKNSLHIERLSTPMCGRLRCAPRFAPRPVTPPVNSTPFRASRANPSRRTNEWTRVESE